MHQRACCYRARLAPSTPACGRADSSALFRLYFFTRAGGASSRSCPALVHPAAASSSDDGCEEAATPAATCECNGWGCRSCFGAATPSAGADAAAGLLAGWQAAAVRSSPSMPVCGLVQGADGGMGPCMAEGRLDGMPSSIASSLSLCNRSKFCTWSSGSPLSHRFRCHAIMVGQCALEGTLSTSDSRRSRRSVRCAHCAAATLSAPGMSRLRCSTGAAQSSTCISHTPN